MSVIVFGDYLKWIQDHSGGGEPVDRLISFCILSDREIIGAVCIYDWVEGEYAYVGGASTTPLWCSRQVVMTVAAIITARLKCNHTLAVVRRNNLASRRFLQKAGFVGVNSESNLQTPDDKLTYVLTASAGAALIERMRTADGRRR